MYLTVNRYKVETMLRGLKGRFFGVTFIKKNGQSRTMNARLGVTKFVSGGRKTVGLNYQPYLTVWSRNDAGYRSVNLATIRMITADGQVYFVR